MLIRLQMFMQMASKSGTSLLFGLTPPRYLSKDTTIVGERQKSSLVINLINISAQSYLRSTIVIYDCIVVLND